MERTVYMDNLRTLMILTIVIFHSALSYTTMLPWWFVLDNKNSQVVDISAIFLDCYQIPVLFLLAGYFSLSSLQKYGTVTFIIKKARKLVIPLVLLSILYTPVMPFIRHTINTANPIGYFDYLKKYLASMLDFGIVIFADMSDTQQYADIFTLSHLWFLSVLFVIFCLAAAVYKIGLQGKMRNRTTEPNRHAFLITGGIIAVAISISGFFIFDWVWIKAGTFFMCQPLRMPVYIGLFFLGMYGYESNWFKQRISGTPWKWLALSLILFACVSACSEKMWVHPDKSNGVLILLNGFFRSFVTIAFVLFFLNFAKKYLNRTNTVLTLLKNHSYELFLLHLPITVMLQLWFAKFNLPIIAKVLLVSVLSMSVSLIVSVLFYKRIQMFFENASFSKHGEDDTLVAEGQTQM